MNAYVYYTLLSVYYSRLQNTIGADFWGEGGQASHQDLVYLKINNNYKWRWAYVKYVTI